MSKKNKHKNGRNDWNDSYQDRSNNRKGNSRDRYADFFDASDSSYGEDDEENGYEDYADEYADEYEDEYENESASEEEEDDEEEEVESEEEYASEEEPEEEYEEEETEEDYEEEEEETEDLVEEEPEPVEEKIAFQEKPAPDPVEKANPPRVSPQAAVQNTAPQQRETKDAVYCLAEPVPNQEKPPQSDHLSNLKTGFIPIRPKLKSAETEEHSVDTEDFDAPESEKKGIFSLFTRFKQKKVLPETEESADTNNVSLSSADEDSPVSAAEESEMPIEEKSGKFSNFLARLKSVLHPKPAQNEADEPNSDSPEEEAAAMAETVEPHQRNWRDIVKKTGIMASAVSLLMVCGYMGTVFLSPEKRAEITEEARNEIALDKNKETGLEEHPLIEKPAEPLISLDEEESKLNEIAGSIQKDIQSTSETLKNETADLLDAVEKPLNETADSINDKITETTDSINNEIANTADSLNDKITDTADSINDGIVNTADSLNDKITDTADSLSASIQEESQKGADTLSLPPDTVTANNNSDTALFTTPAPPPAAADSSLENSIQQSVTQVQNQFDSLGASVSNTAQQVVQDTGTAIENSWNNLQNQANSAMQSLQQTGSDIQQSTTASINQTADTLTQTIDQAAGSIQNLQANPAPLSESSLAGTGAVTSLPTEKPAAEVSGRSGSLSIPLASGQETVSLTPAVSTSSDELAVNSLTLPPPTMSHSVLGNYSAPNQTIPAAPSTGSTASGLSTATATSAASTASTGSLSVNIPSTGTTAGTTAQPAAANTAAGTGSRTYTTQANDNLLTIAETQLGDSTRWGEIRRLNPDKDLTGSIPVGTVIQIPAL